MLVIPPRDSACYRYSGAARSPIAGGRRTGTRTNPFIPAGSARRSALFEGAAQQAWCRGSVQPDCTPPFDHCLFRPAQPNNNGTTRCDAATALLPHNLGVAMAAYACSTSWARSPDVQTLRTSPRSRIHPARHRRSRTSRFRGAHARRCLQLRDWRHHPHALPPGVRVSQVLNRLRA